VRGALQVHVGWLFGSDPTSKERYAPDLLADRSMRAVLRAFPALCVASLALPCGIAWALGGFSARAALLAPLWAGLVRIFLLSERHSPSPPVQIPGSPQPTSQAGRDQPRN
jgi:stearoyl-CoA desaturase (Delta-9 desaturase)